MSMAAAPASDFAPKRLATTALDLLVQGLRDAGYLTIGPRVAGGAIVYDEITGAADLPRGWGDEQEKGFYRLKKLPDPLFFGFNASPQSWKKFLQPERVCLWQARRENGRLVFYADAPEARPLALIGVRSCDFHAMAIQETVQARSALAANGQGATAPFLVGVDCGQAAATCFCAAMSTGPALPSDACDLTLTELFSPEEHIFIARAATARGQSQLALLPAADASAGDIAAAAQAVAAARSQQVRSLPTVGLPEFLAKNLESSHWETVASRCLSCANCTLVCPTCFCTTTEDVTDLSGDHAARWQRWDSCFNLDFSYIHGGSVRKSTRARYRQWLTHKLGTWQAQFGSSGCVGCGRCIAWCPVGIDLTEEVAALAATSARENPLCP